jgi:hypothetical protein
MRVRRLVASWVGVVACLLFVRFATATSITITIDTPMLVGTDAVLAFDLINGGTPMTNTVTLGDLSTDGSLGSAYLTHDLITFDPAPDLSSSVPFSDSDFFTEYGQALTLGTTLVFTIDVTDNLDFPNPDELTVFLLDDGGISSLVTTTDDRLGANALLRYTLGQANQPVLFDVADGSGTTISVSEALPVNVPEPATLLLFAGAMLALFPKARLTR